jgi:hypothetical protein
MEKALKSPVFLIRIKIPVIIIIIIIITRIIKRIFVKFHVGEKDHA